jgi:hypothetical protein
VLGSTNGPSKLEETAEEQLLRVLSTAHTQHAINYSAVISSVAHQTDPLATSVAKVAL